MNKKLAFITKVKFHPLLWVIMLLAVVTANFLELCILLFVVFVHEIGHAVVASHFNWRIKSIVLLPFGGMAEMEEHGNRPLKEELLVIIAGPIQHIWMVGLAFLLFQLEWMSASFFATFLYYNMMIFIFNLLPIWPLDGGKILYSLLSLNKSFLKAHNDIILLSLVFTSIFSCITIFLAPFNLSTWIIIGFLFMSIYLENKQKRYIFMRFLIERYYGTEQVAHDLKPIIVDMNTEVIRVLEMFKRGAKHPIIVRENGKEKGILDENEVLHAYFSDKLVTTRIGDLLYSY